MLTHDTSLAAHALAVDATVVRVFGALLRRNVVPILLKGGSIEAWLYDDGAPRIAGDVDLLVAPSDRLTTERELKALGFVNKYDGPSPVWADEHADAWTPPPGLVPLDLHRRLWGVGTSQSVAWDTLHADRDLLRIGPIEVPVLGPSGRLLVVALHAAHHGVGVSRPVHELGLAIARCDDAAWRAVVRLAKELDASQGLAAGLGLLDEGATLRDRLGLRPTDREVVLRHIPMWFEPATAAGFLSLLQARSLRDRAHLIRHEVLPSSEFMHARYDAASDGLVRAHLRRWARLVRDAPAGFRAARAIHRRRARR